MKLQNLVFISFASMFNDLDYKLVPKKKEKKNMLGLVT